MDLIPEGFHELFQFWLLHYGVLALFILLALGIIALPVPEETLLIFSGILISKGIFSIWPTFLCAYFGSILGITVSYLIGLFGGLIVIKKYGGYVGLTEKKMENAHNWFERYGKWILFVGYFIPGLRHFTGIFAGVSTLEYRHFAFFAYSGAFFWVTLFLSVGYFSGTYYENLVEIVEENVESLFLVLILLVILFIVFRLWKNGALRNKEN
jgi:membrane protein DedA with SNARE-associated domain